MRMEVSDLDSAGQFDFCVIGTGPAGITTAMSLAADGKRVVLLEAGQEEYTEESQDHYKGTIVGDEYLDLEFTHLRYFGGTSNHWGGWCKTLDAIDFEGKKGFPDTEWPIRKTDLDPYLKQTAEILEVPLFEPDMPLADSGFKSTDFTFSPPVLFGEKYGDALKADPNIALVFDAALTAFDTNGTAITAAKIKDSQGAEYSVHADRFILAAGGIENSRLLLWANAQTNDQIVKNTKSLGRYWMEHPAMTVGDVLMTTEFANSVMQDGIAFISPSAEWISQNDALNCLLYLESMTYRGVKAMIADVMCVAPDFGRWAFQQVNKSLYCGTNFRCGVEQLPLEKNRIELSDELDSSGMPRTILYWTKGEAELQSFRKAARGLADYMAKADVGRVHLKPWVLSEGSFPKEYDDVPGHHMGGTRMSDNSNRGVVDRNCKIHGQENLYIAGSSVFTSGGYANPTFSIVQLALRLSDHLKSL
jgi:choline dehydrogenase-like flavoprotein